MGDAIERGTGKTSLTDDALTVGELNKQIDEGIE